jgi:hypothetical protein
MAREPQWLSKRHLLVDCLLGGLKSRDIFCHAILRGG